TIGNTGLGTILDNDAAPTLTISNESVTEGGSLVFDLTLSNPSSETIVVSLNTGSGTATEGADYTSIDGHLVTFAAGQTAATVTVQSAHDTVMEPDETFIVSATAVSGTVNTADTGTGTILNDDAAPLGGSVSASVREAGNEAVPGHFEAGTDAASNDEIAGPQNLNLSFGPDGPHAVSPFAWSTSVTAIDTEGGDPALGTLTSGGYPVAWQVSSDGLTLEGIVQGGPHDGQVVATLTANITGSGSGAQVSFTYEQKGPIDHPDEGEAEGADMIQLGFSYTVQDATGDTATGSLTVNVLDDAPGSGEIVKAASIDSGMNDVNVAFVIDVSISMDTVVDAGGPGSGDDVTRLDVAIEALKTTLQQAVDAGVNGPVMVAAFHGDRSGGTVHPAVTVTTFASAAAALAGVEAFFNTVKASDEWSDGGSTRYEGGLDAVADWFNGSLGTVSSDNQTIIGSVIDPINVGNADNRVFLLTDGANNQGAGGFDPTAQNVEALYGNVTDSVNNTPDIPNLTIKTVGITVESTYQNDLDRTDDGLVNGSVVNISDEAGAQGIVAGFGEITGENTVSGNLFVDDDLIDGPGADSAVPEAGADGLVAVYSFTFQASGGPQTIYADDSGVEFTTALGGTISVDFATGIYNYVAPTSGASGVEDFSYVVVDGDGDPLNGSLTVNVAGPTLSIGDAVALEGNQLVFEITRAGAVSGVTSTVTVNSSSGTATEGTDFNSIDGTVVTFAPGQTSAFVTVQSKTDAVTEGNESFTLSLANPVNASLADGTGTGTILDAGSPGVLNGEIVTNTNSGVQRSILTFVQKADNDSSTFDGPMHAYAQLFAHAGTGQSQSFLSQTGWDIATDHDYFVAFEHGGGTSSSINVTDFSIEGVTIQGSGTTQLDATPGGGSARVAFTAVINPPGGGDINGVIQAKTASTDGTDPGSSNADSLSDPSSSTFSYLAGLEGNDSLNGSNGTDILNGGPDTGDSGSGNGADRLTASGGDDILVWDADDTRIDGGSGFDILRIDDGAVAVFNAMYPGFSGPAQSVSANLVTTVDFTTISGLDDKVRNIEALLLTEEHTAGEFQGTKVVLDAQSVLDITDDSGDSALLYIVGNAGDKVELTGGDWSNAGSGNGFNDFSTVYNGVNVTVRVEDDIRLNDIVTT
ncbi:MAG: beta strand repeat-containing protein, partial [Alphaproteobacteria bacterium]